MPTTAVGSNDKPKSAKHDLSSAATRRSSTGVALLNHTFENEANPGRVSGLFALFVEAPERAADKGSDSCVPGDSFDYPGKLRSAVTSSRARHRPGAGKRWIARTAHCALRTAH